MAPYLNWAMQGFSSVGLLIFWKKWTYIRNQSWAKDTWNIIKILFYYLKSSACCGFPSLSTGGNETNWIIFSFLRWKDLELRLHHSRPKLTNHFFLSESLKGFILFSFVLHNQIKIASSNLHAIASIYTGRKSLI